MRILLSNDGIHAPGIQQLAVTLRQLAIVQIMAPNRDRSGKIFNVNVPNLSLSSINGCKVTRCSSSHPASEVIRQTDLRGCKILWIVPPDGLFDKVPGTDFEAVSHGYISLTPLQVDLTANAALPVPSDWLGDTDGEELAPW